MSIKTEIVDEEDHVIGLANEEEVRKKNLLHHSVHVAIIDSMGRLFCAHRAKQKPVYGDWWTVPGAHLHPGDTYEKASRRLLSELGLTGHLENKDKIRVNDGFENEFSMIYVFRSNSLPSLKPTEFKEGKFFTYDEAKKLATNQNVTPYLLHSLEFF